MYIRVGCVYLSKDFNKNNYESLRKLEGNCKGEERKVSTSSHVHKRIGERTEKMRRNCNPKVFDRRPGFCDKVQNREICRMDWKMSLC